MLIRSSAHARAGLIGNPSDGYYGKTIAHILRNFKASVLCYESPMLSIQSSRQDRLAFQSREELLETIDLNGYYGGVRLLKASLKVFCDHCRNRGISLGNRTCTLEYSTNIPVQVGLAGSSAIITAAMRALMEFYDVEIPDAELPNLVLSVENDELNISAGLQDRVIQVYEGVVFMDFDRSFMEEHGHGAYESLPASNLPPLFVAYHKDLARGTEETHNDLRARFERGEREVVRAMDQFAAYAQKARDYILEDRAEEMGPLLDKNFDLRAELYDVGDGNHRLVNIGRRQGAHVKFCGSGGAVVGMYDGDPERLQALRESYNEFGADLVLPQIQPAKTDTNGQPLRDDFKSDYSGRRDGHPIPTGNQVDA